MEFTFQVLGSTFCALVVWVVELTFVSDVSLCFDSVGPGLSALWVLPSKSSQEP